MEHKIRRLKIALSCTGAVVVVASIAGFVYFSFLPFWESKKLQLQRTEQLHMLLERAARVQTEHRQLKANLVSLRNSVDQTLQRLPAEMREVEFINEVKALAAKLDVEVENYLISNVEHHASFSKAQAVIDCSGCFASICRLLDGVSHFSRLTELSRLEVEPGEKLGRYPFQVTFVLYFLGKSHDRRVRGGIL